MNKPKLIALLPFVLCTLALAADTQWVLQQCTLTYHVSHPLHQTDGISHAARGKGTSGGAATQAGAAAKVARP